LISSPQHFFVLDVDSSVRPSCCCCGHCCSWADWWWSSIIDYFHTTMSNFNHCLWSCSLIIVISVILSPFDNLFVAIAINFQMANIRSRMSNDQMSLEFSYHRLTIRFVSLLDHPIRIIAWPSDSYDHLTIRFVSSLDHKILIIAWPSDCCCHCHALSRCGWSLPNGHWKEKTVTTTIGWSSDDKNRMVKQWYKSDGQTMIRKFKWHLVIWHSWSDIGHLKIDSNSNK
jgi:hypothetical protein